MAVLHDLICTAETCRWHEEGWVENGQYPLCPICGADTTWMPTGLHTDVYGSEQYSDAAGRSFSSQHEKEIFMARKGYVVAGDPVGGARADHRIRGSGFSYARQGSRQSAAERGGAKRGTG